MRHQSCWNGAIHLHFYVYWGNFKHWYRNAPVLDVWTCHRNLTVYVDQTSWRRWGSGIKRHRYFASKWIIYNMEIQQNVVAVSLCLRGHLVSFISNALLHIEAYTKWPTFPDDIFKCIFLNANIWISIKIPLQFIPEGPINNVPASVMITVLSLSELSLSEFNDAIMRYSTTSS